LAVALRTPAGALVLHTGDFKMDQVPLDGRITDLRAFARLGEEGVDLFLVDSTNAEVPGFVPAERSIEPVIDAVFARSDHRVIAACFASHIHRVQQILDVAARHHRRVAFIGRSMVRNMGVARDLGYLTIPAGLVVSVDEIDLLPDDQVVLVCTGSQGEPMAALSRMASNDHPIRVAPGDTVLLASSLIPGNENAVFRVLNGLSRLGANVVHKGNALVHVSGHAAEGELTYCYNIVRPANVLPVHGEWRHMRANGAIAVRTGIPADRVILADNGTVIDLVDHVATVVGAVPCGFVYVDGASVGDITETSLKDRRILGSEGFISVVAVVDLTDGKVVGGPDIHARGFTGTDAVFDEVRPRIAAALEDALRGGATDTFELQRVVRRAVGRWVSDTHRRRPMIIPVVVEV
jgi:ribonuclease J